MIHFQAKKLYNNRVSVRDCIVNNRKKEVVEVTVTGLEGRMRINSKTPYTTDNITHIAQYDDEFIKKGKGYVLFDYEWKPIEEHKDEQTADGLKKLHEVYLKVFGNKSEQLKI